LADITTDLRELVFHEDVFLAGAKRP